MTEPLFTDVVLWQRETFPQKTYYSIAKHLQAEVEELRGAQNDEAVQEELADCFLLLFGIADEVGMNYDDVCKAIEAKMEVNRKRV
jgi:NTP pyrophosphatase (non-canonical NTP hydrolase)